MPDAVKQLAFHPTTLIFAIVICSIVAGIWIDVVLRRLLDKITFIRPNIPTSLHMQFRAGTHNAIQLANRNIENSHFERQAFRSEEHTSELQSLMRISYAVFCLKKNNNQ